PRSRARSRRRLSSLRARCGRDAAATRQAAPRHRDDLPRAVDAATDASDTAINHPARRAATETAVRSDAPRSPDDRAARFAYRALTRRSEAMRHRGGTEEMT